ncbi:MAG: YwaF family protein [Clostridia bacterium]|nr:YwaF family protein [Clostridia bacterium]
MERRGGWILASMGHVLAVSLVATEAILLLEGRWQEALPLHLCSLSAMAALVLAFGEHGMLLDFLWYLGMPGAALALIFPAPAVTRCQALLNASYVTTHALILIIPLTAMLAGMRPRRGRAPAMMMILQGIALVAYFVNRALGTDFLFLMAPPAGTPLVTAYSWGYPAYLLALEAIMLAVCMVMDTILSQLCRKSSE